MPVVPHCYSATLQYYNIYSNVDSGYDEPRTLVRLFAVTRDRSYKCIMACSMIDKDHRDMKKVFVITENSV